MRQRGAHQVADVRVVVHHQHPQSPQRLEVAAAAVGHGLRLGLDVGRGACQRQLYRERRPLAVTLAARAHRPTVKLDEVTHDRQPEAEAGVGPPRGAGRLPERLEHVR